MNRTQKLKHNSDGFGHIELVVIIALVLAVGAVGYYVYSHDDNTKSPIASLTPANKLDKSSATTETKTTVTAAKPLTQAEENTPTVAASSPSSSSSKIASTSVSAKGKTDTSTTTHTTTTTSSPTSTPAPTPLSTLTNIIAGLDSGQSEATVTTGNVAIPGPITTAQGRPIVFTLNGQTYFAYTQEQAPNFSTSAAQTASTMAIVTTNGSGYTTTQAHLDKIGELVDENEAAVGYSTGGD